MNDRLILKKNVKKYAPYVLLTLLLFFIISLSIPKLTSTRDDALRSRAYHDQEAISDSSKTEPTNYNLDSSLYEIKKYEISYKTNETNRLQQNIKTLKTKEYVLFDKYSESKSRSSYILKVNRDHSTEVLEFLKSLSPEDINLYVENIKKSIESSIDEEKLLNEKLDRVEKILNNANESYSSLLISAKEENNIDALTKLVELKINTLDRLTNEKSAILSKINAISKSKQELLDSLNYVIFHISIDEFLYIDIDSLKSSWRYDVKMLIVDINSLAQSITTSFLSFIIKLINFFIYFIIILFIVKIAIYIVKKVFKLEKLSLFDIEKDENTK